MAATLGLLAVLAGLIYISCELFVNGIEWVGRKFHIADSAVGSVLAALGTALPESVVTLLAVAFGSGAGQKDIGVGAAIGGPLILSTVGYSIVGWGLLGFRRRGEMEIDNDKLWHDQQWFLVIFLVNTVLGVMTFAGKAWIGLLFVCAYGVYFFREMSAEDEKVKSEIAPLKIRPYRQDPEVFWVLAQTLFSLGLIFVCSQVFVARLEHLSTLIAMPPQLVSLLLSPLATELPEILNAVIWIRQGKEMLALGNVSGSMMIQTTIPSALGIFFTPWRFDVYLLLAAVATVASIGFLMFMLRHRRISPRKLAFAGSFYLIFAAAAIAVRLIRHV